jgi:transcriptional regulator of acetoin/glycerol metabolism
MSASLVTSAPTDGDIRAPLEPTPTKPMPYDATTLDGLAAIARVRERFFANPNTDLSRIRPRVARSWRRTAAMRIDPEAPVQIDGSARVDDQTLRCAAPFVRELERMALDAGGDVTVISPSGVLVHDLTPAIEDRYPNGLVLLESVCGTNGDGTALEEGQSGWVYSREHYRADFSLTSCYSVLIRDPFRDNVRACITLTLPEAVVSSSDPHAVGLVAEGMAAKITRELAARSATREQMLFAEYLKVARRYRNGAILATDGKHTTVSDAALELLREDDFAAISSYAQEALRSRRPVKQDVTLSGDRLVRLHITMAGEGQNPLGAIVVVKSTACQRLECGGGGNAASAPAGKTSLRVFDDLVGESQAFRQALDLATAAIARRAPVHVIGGRGTGKRTIALRIAHAWTADVETIDTARLQDDTSSLLESVRVRVQSGGTVVLHDADLLPVSVSEALAELLRQVERPQVLLTLRRPTASASVLLSALNSVEISLPPLRGRREDIPALATRFTADITDKRPSARLLYVLAQADWPGNVSQLKSVVEQAAMVARGTEVSVADLPQSFRGGVSQGSLSRLEEVELQELRAALDEANGNRSLAADILQIGRSTLYRRLDSYRCRGIVI